MNSRMMASESTRGVDTQGEILFEKVPTKSMRYGEMHIFFEVG